jgi:small-conductance mechanosensitive channel/CRP-like cAMP-binding protein
MTAVLPTLRELGILLSAAIGVYVVLVGLAHLLRQGRGLRFGWTYHAFAILTALLTGMHLSGWSDSVTVEVMRHLTAAVLVFAAFPVIVLLNRILWHRTADQRRGGEMPRVLTDLTGVLALAAAALAALQYVYAVEVPGLLAGSGVLALIVGLAMQDLLGNLIAGVSLHFDKSFAPGDWLEIEGTDAKVIELSWRSTRLVTDEDVMIDVPNSTIVKGVIRNFQKPTPRHALKVRLGLHCDIPPMRVQEVLGRAAAGVDGVCVDPSPSVRLVDFADSAITYEIKVWIDDHARDTEVMSDVRVRCWYAAKRAGFDIPYPQMVLHRPAPAPSDPALEATARSTLAEHAVFGVLSDEQRGLVLANAPTQLYAEGESIVVQGERGTSMYLVLRGEVEVWVEREGRRQQVSKLAAGDCFGEMSLLTGEPRTATVNAAEEVTALKITKANLTALLNASPELLVRLSEVLVQRQLNLEKLAADAAPAHRVEAARKTMLTRLRSFFELGGA